MIGQKPRWNWGRELCIEALHEALRSASSLEEVGRILTRNFRPQRFGTESIGVPTVAQGLRRREVQCALRARFPDDADALLKKFEKQPVYTKRNKGRRTTPSTPDSWRGS
jgi:hypothetical protein